MTARSVHRILVAAAIGIAVLDGTSAQAQARGQGPAQGQAQGTTPVAGQARRDSTGQQGKRRAIDIRATAPAPEVVTIRPRQIPAFSRALLVPTAIRPPAPGDQPPATVVIFPGSLPVPRPTAPAPSRRPDTTTPPPE